jgi:hypothetical protein
MKFFLKRIYRDESFQPVVMRGVDAWGNNKEEILKRIDVWNITMRRAHTYLYTYEYVPASCIKKLFGSDDWAEEREWPL